MIFRSYPGHGAKGRQMPFEDLTSMYGRCTRVSFCGLYRHGRKNLLLEQELGNAPAVMQVPVYSKKVLVPAKEANLDPMLVIAVQSMVLSTRYLRDCG